MDKVDVMSTLSTSWNILIWSWMKSASLFHFRRWLLFWVLFTYFWGIHSTFRFWRVFSIGCNPVVAECDGEYNYDSRKNVITWSMPILDSSNKTGSMEFSAPNCNPDDFFPLQVNFTSKQSYAHLKVIHCYQMKFFRGPCSCFSTLISFFIDFSDHRGCSSGWWCAS